MNLRIGLLLAVLFCTIHHVSGQVEWHRRTDKIISGACKAVVYKNKIYVTSTNADQRIVIEEYNPLNDTWVLKKAVSHTENAGEFCLVATPSGIFIIGGYRAGYSLNTVEKYDVDKDTFLLMQDMPIGLDCAVAVSMENLIYVIGGRSAIDSPLSDKVYTFDPVKATWIEKKPAPTARVESHAIVFNNKIYLFGGYVSSNNSGDIDRCNNIIDEYDPVTDLWNAGELDYAPGKTSIGMGVIKNKIYFVVADFGHAGPIAEQVFKYDPLSKTAARIADRSELTWLMGTASLKDSIYFIGGIKGEFPDGERQRATLILSLPGPDE